MNTEPENVGRSIKQWNEEVDSEVPVSMTHRTDTDYGGSFTRYTLCQVRGDASDSQVQDWVAEQFPGDYCQHSYDCCGRYYPSQGIWTELKGHFGRGRMIIVSQRFTQNV